MPVPVPVPVDPVKNLFVIHNELDRLMDEIRSLQNMAHDIGLKIDSLSFTISQFRLLRLQLLCERLEMLSEASDDQEMNEGVESGQEDEENDVEVEVELDEAHQKPN